MALSRTSCAASCARTRRSPIRTPPLAVDLRNQIREQLAAAARASARCSTSWSQRYGDFVLYRPPFKASTAAALGRSVPAPAPGTLSPGEEGAVDQPAGSAAFRGASACARPPTSRARNDPLLDSRRAAGGRRAGACCCGRLWRARAAARPVSRDAMNVAVYRDQLRELDADLAAGTLAQADHERARQEIERRVPRGFSACRMERSPPREGTRSVARMRSWRCRCLRSACISCVGSPGADRAARRAARRPISRSKRMVERLAAKLKRKSRRRRRLEAARPLLCGARPLSRIGRGLCAGGGALAARCGPARRFRRRARHGERAEPRRASRKSWSSARCRSIRTTSRDWRWPVPRPSSAGTTPAPRRAGSACCRWCRPDSEDARIIRENVQEARAKGGVEAKAAGSPAKPAASGAKLAGTVTLSPKLKGRAAPDDTVFIFARAVDGPRVPLAVMTLEGARLAGVLLAR